MKEFALCRGMTESVEEFPNKIKIPILNLEDVPDYDYEEAQVP
jgi:hypothetical protein